MPTARNYVDLMIYRQYEFHGIKVLVEINRYQKTVALVEPDPKGVGFRAKEWKFSDRKIEYMNGWLNIVDAMFLAIKEAKKELEVFKDEDTEKLGMSSLH